MRKLLTLILLIFVGDLSLSAQPGAPFQYGKSVYIAVQGGGNVLMGDYSSNFSDNGDGARLLSPHAGAVIGYNLTDAHEVRLTGTYFKGMSGVLPPENGYCPYKFDAADFFVDYVLNFNALGEYSTPLNPRMYVGLGAGASFNVSDQDGPYDMVHEFSVVPGFTFGTIIECDFLSGLGLFADLGLKFFTDRFNGLDRISFPVDFDINLSFGVVWHLKRMK